MTIRLTCPECQTALTLADSLRGKKVRCKGCEKVLSIPAAKALAGADDDDHAQEDAIQERPRLKATRTADEDAPQEDEPKKKKKKKKKTDKGSAALLIGAGAAVFVLLIVGGGVFAIFYLKKPEERNKQEPLAGLAAKDPKLAKDANGKAVVPVKTDEPIRIIPKIQDGNPATKKGGTYIITNVRGAGYRTERRSELANIGKSYVQYSDEFKGANRNMDTWLEHIKTFGPIREAVKDGYYKMNFNARLESGSVIAYERDIDVGEQHLCVRGDGSVDHVPLAELKKILGRDP